MGQLDKKSFAFLFQKWKYTLFTYTVLFTIFKYSHQKQSYRNLKRAPIRNYLRRKTSFKVEIHFSHENHTL